MLRSSLCIFFLLTLACDPAGALCEEACEQDSDCDLGLTCANNASGGRCVPNECEQCFEFGDTCFYDRMQDDNGDLVCHFTACN